MKLLLTGPAGLFREGVASLLRLYAADVEVCVRDGLAGSISDDPKPDCIVMDGDALRQSAAEHEALREQARAIPLVVLLGAAQKADIDGLIADGVAGCVEKSASADMLFGALRVALAGGVYFPRAFLAGNPVAPVPSSIRATPAHRGEASPNADAHARLTPRQIEVLALLARGRSNKMIARELDCAEATVKTHLTTIFKALNVASRGEASAAAARMERVRETQVARAIDGQVSLGRLLANMESQRFRAGEVLFRKGDASGELFYVEKGTVTLSELGIELGAGSVLGEIGLFSPGHRRTSTAVCKTECEMRTVCAADAIRLYYQEPEFALHLLRLIVGRLQADKLREG